MRTSTFWLEVEDGAKLFVRVWEPDAAAPKAVVQIAHGMAEHGGRYERVAERLTAAGYVVYAHDHRGHGQTAPSRADLGYFADQEGFMRAVRDMLALSARIRAERPGLPLFMMGHSMGSMLVRLYLFQSEAPPLAGVVLSGTSGRTTELAWLGILLGKGERLRVGPRRVSKLLQLASVGAYNLGFRPNRTPHDWLSRDPAEVDKYAADPLCAFDLTVQGWLDVYSGALAIEREADIARLPKDLPLYLFAGSRDPVGGDTRGGRWLHDALRRAGMRDVTTRFYPDARHETLNETNRDEVERELVAWLDLALARWKEPGGKRDGQGGVHPPRAVS
ncbi:MAG TPA: alpha/beta hydrolase [Polyangiales bacterium]|nr:alpha/beta hydrolase [Polyangiales bacterium]